MLLITKGKKLNFRICLLRRVGHTPLLFHKQLILKKMKEKIAESIQTKTFVATGNATRTLGFSTAWATSCLNMNFMKYFTYCIICVIFPDLPPPWCSKLQHPIMELTKIWLTLEYETLQTSNDLMDPWQVITLLIFVFMIYFFCYKFFVWITFVCSWYFHFVAHDASTT